MDTFLHWVFLVCAIGGSIVMILQFGLSMLGLSHDLGLPHDMPYDIPHDIPHDLPAHDVAPIDGAHSHVPEHGPSSLYSFFSLRGMVAGVTFIGIAGLICQESHLSFLPMVVICLCSAMVAMFIVYFMLLAMSRMHADGTVRIEQAVGLAAVVHLSIPPGRSGKGKILLRLPDRFCEYQAQTTSPQVLRTGAKVVVTGVMGPSLLEVAPAEMVKPAEALGAGAELK